MKKHVYTIQTDIYDNTLTSLETEITKAEYKRQREHLMSQALDPIHNQGDEFEISYVSTTKGCETMTIYRERWTNGCSDIYLTEYVAKDGYHFN